MSKKDPDPWVRTFTVSDSVRHKKGYTLYKVVSKVFPKNSVEAVTQVTVWKRYNDFKKLHKSLHSMHQGLYLKGTFPTFAKARFFGRFDEQVIEERRQCALELLDFAAKYSPLFTSQVFVKFFEAGQVLDIPPETTIKCDAPLLQPSVSIFQETLSADSALSIPHEDSDNSSILGGIWKHRRSADENSVDSQNDSAEEDDRTTFTDDERLSSSKPSFDVTEFDPVLQSAIPDSLRTSSHAQELCNDWLLSAFSSCGVSKDKDSECALAFPKPFEAFEDLDTVSQTLHDEFSNDLLCIEKIVSNLPSPPVPNNEQIASSSLNEDSSDGAPHGSDDMPKECPPYVLDAVKYVTAAHRAEVGMNYFDAFSYYKAAVDILLQGVEGEKSEEESEPIRRKILEYLQRAEQLYETHLCLDEPVQNKLSEISGKVGSFGLHRPVADLAKYRVIGILSHVLLVLDTVTNCTCIVKVLRKSSDPQLQNIPNIAPQGIPFMVELYEVYETQDAIYLVLEYACGGRLWEYISSYLQRSPPSVVQCDDQNEDSVTITLMNIYSGKKLHNNKTSAFAKDDCVPQLRTPEVTFQVSAPHSDSDLTTSKNYPSSYIALFKNYFQEADEKNMVSLAKCNIPLSKSKEIKNCGVLPTHYKNARDYGLLEVTNIIDGLSQRHMKKSASAASLSSKCVDSIINDSKALLENVDSTLKRSSWNCGLDKISKHEKQGSSVQTFARIHSLLSSMEGNFSAAEKDNLDGKSILKPGQNTESFEIIHSHASTELSKPKKTCLTEMFGQMDVIVSSGISKSSYLPESCIVMWIAEIVTALNALHKLGIIWRDLMPENILLGSEGHILLTYQSVWNSVDHITSARAKKNLYCAPEINGIVPVTSVCDFWSLGVILFELLSGKKLVCCHPYGITSHTKLWIPDDISYEARDLLTKFLTFNPSERLGSGSEGIEDIKFHPFFRAYKWS